MTDIKLKDELEKLRTEVKELATDNIEATEKLEALIGEIEKKLQEPSNPDQNTSLVEDLKDAISQFETEHPRATAILNDIMVTLSNMGI